MEKLVSIVVTTWDSFDLTKQCIDSIKENTEYLSYKIILVDNGSKDGSIEKLEKEFKDIRIIKNKINKGFPYALNQGYIAAESFYVVHLNNDAFVTKGWLEELIKTIDSNEKFAVVGVKEVSPKKFNDKKLIEKIKQKPNREKLTLPVGWITKKKFIEEIGYLDAEHFSPAYGEEADWNFRARSKGYKIIECSKCIVVHYSSQGSIKSMSAKNHYILVNTHRLRSFFFNLGLMDLLGFVPGMGLIFLQSIKDGQFFWLMRAYWNNIKDLKLILRERAKRKKSVFIPFREPKFSPPFEMEKE
ncbi:glycosyltransferase family 2 protein [Candidatus Micrarchaeota archaeon]|nr:glycosyltransferase family 2 protein [Candidatus Micrarchaeota archaeon]MBU2476462.1 glycosyltransferase family 2 protein [Candidatus Micrarchaeota archaeon]